MCDLYYNMATMRIVQDPVSFCCAVYNIVIASITWKSGMLRISIENGTGSYNELIFFIATVCTAHSSAELRLMLHATN
jgi:type IV secretory pathway VirB2 component (pilin)